MTSMCRNLNWNRIVSPVVAINALIYGDTVIYADVTAGQPIAKPFVSGAARRGVAPADGPYMPAVCRGVRVSYMGL